VGNVRNEWVEESVVEGRPVLPKERNPRAESRGFLRSKGGGCGVGFLALRRYGTCPNQSAEVGPDGFETKVQKSIEGNAEGK